MKKDGYSDNTIGPIGRRLRNLARHVNLDDPESVKEFIAKAEWSNGYKENLVNACMTHELLHIDCMRANCFAWIPTQRLIRMEGVTWG